MKLTNLPSEFQKALPILEKIKAAGFEAYFVGGSVRDAILGRPIHDVDIATSSYPQETKAIFDRTVDIGIEHGTVLVLENGGEYEVTTFRTEDVYVDYRRPSSVSFVRSLNEDLKRRDFTVNAFALSETGEIIDQFNGLHDLQQQILRAVGVPSERFHEDALRIMRGFRFAATLGFSIESETFAAMVETAPLLEKISVERSFIEFDKLLMAPHWQRGLDVFLKSEAYLYLPEMTQAKDGLQDLMDRIDTEFVFETAEQAWACIIMALGQQDAKTFLRKWKTSNEFQRDVALLVDLFHRREKASLTKMDAYVFGKDRLLLVESLRRAFGWPTDFDVIRQLDEELVIHDKTEIAVNGSLLMKELGLKPGPHLGQVLKEVETAIVLGHLANEKAAIFDFVREKNTDE